MASFDTRMLDYGITPREIQILMDLNQLNQKGQEKPSTKDQILDVGKDVGKKVVKEQVRDNLLQQLGKEFGTQAATDTGVYGMSTEAGPVLVNSAGEIIGSGTGELAANTGTDLLGANTGMLGNLAQGAAGLGMMYGGGKMALDANKIGGDRGTAMGGIGGGLAGGGLGMALGAAGLALGPVGWAALIGAGLMGGGLAGARLGDKDKWKTEDKRWDKLIKDNPELQKYADTYKPNIKMGRTKEEMQRADLAQDFTGFDPNGQWVNNKFNQSRQVTDLTPIDIIGYSKMFEKMGNASVEQRMEAARRALEAGAVKEHHGTIDVDWNKVDMNGISDIQGDDNIQNDVAHLQQWWNTRNSGQPAATNPTSTPQIQGSMGYRPAQLNPEVSEKWGDLLGNRPNVAIQPRTDSSNQLTPEMVGKLTGGIPGGIGAALGNSPSLTSDPRQSAGYAQMSKQAKDDLWSQHRKAMGATW